MNAPATDVTEQQRERFERILRVLEIEPDSLHADDRRFLLWLASWDEEVENGFLSIVDELQIRALRRRLNRRDADHAMSEQLEDIGRQPYSVQRTLTLSADHLGGCLCPQPMRAIQGRR